MQCCHCGEYIDTRFPADDGTVVCPGCGASYRKKRSVKEPPEIDTPLNPDDYDLENPEIPEPEIEWVLDEEESPVYRRSHIGAIIAVIIFLSLCAGVAVFLAFRSQLSKSPAPEPTNTPPSAEPTYSQPLEQPTPIIPTPAAAEPATIETPTPTYVDISTPEPTPAAVDLSEPLALCNAGDLYGAAEWLFNNPEDFPEREYLENAIVLYLPFCSDWALVYGSSGIIPWASSDPTLTMKYRSIVMLNSEGATMRIFYDDGFVKYTDFYASIGDFEFKREGHDSNTWTEYVVRINQNDHLIVFRHESNGVLWDSCEYERTSYY